jgi:hypothetical protein
MKVAELEGALLDHWVARAQGVEGIVDMMFMPSTNWEHGGPIIERERIELLPGDEWEAFINPHPDAHWNAVLGMPTGVALYWKGGTPLVAAMRAYVASKFGKEMHG